MNPYDDIELVEPFSIEDDTTIEYVGNTSPYDGHCLRSYSYYPKEIKRWEDLKYLNKNQKFYKDPKTNKYYTEEELASVD